MRPLFSTSHAKAHALPRGAYDLFHFGYVTYRIIGSPCQTGLISHALQLRQAKLSFPSVYLLVDVNSDELDKEHKVNTVMSHQEK